MEKVLARIAPFALLQSPRYNFPRWVTLSPNWCLNRSGEETNQGAFGLKFCASSEDSGCGRGYLRFLQRHVTLRRLHHKRLRSPLVRILMQDKGMRCLR